MPKYCRSDKCQEQIVKELRQLGARVLVVSQFKLGFDIIVGLFGAVGLFELKNKSSDKLTDNEDIFFHEWFGYVSRAHSTQEIVSIMSGLAVRF